MVLSLINQRNFNLNLKKIFTGNEKLLISTSCGVDSTVLFYLIRNSKFFKEKNIFYVFFDHQQRAEGKLEIKKFAEHYNLKKNQYFIKKIKFNSNDKSFQNTSRLSRHRFIRSISKKMKIKEIFLGHHLDDLYETFFLRYLQQSNITGLNYIFSETILSLNFHRPLLNYKKKEILNFAIKAKLFWSEDRTNSQLDYTRNKIRSFLSIKKNINNVAKKRNDFLDFQKINNMHNKFLEKLDNGTYEVNYNEFNRLNETLKIFVIQSFFYNLRKDLNKTIRKKNSLNLIEILKNPSEINKKRSIFGGKITSYNKKICLNLNLDFKRN